MSLSGSLEALPGWIAGVVEANPLLGYGAIALVMLLENVVPPIPSEVVMPLAGSLVQQGKLSLEPVVLAGLAGTVLGAWFWYSLGRLVDESRLERWVARRGRWLGIAPDALARGRRWFLRHGAAVVFWGRLLPGVRTFISVPAGVERMPLRSFLLWTSAGSLIWILMLTLAGMVLGANYGRVALWLAPFTHWILTVVAGAGAIVLMLQLRRILRLQRGRR